MKRTIKTHPAEESATTDLAFLGAELTRLRADAVHLQAKRDKLSATVVEANQLYQELIEFSNKCYLRIDLNQALLNTKIQNTTRLIMNELPNPYGDTLGCAQPMSR